jgi:hypothetical protein
VIQLLSQLQPHQLADWKHHAGALVMMATSDALSEF